MKKIINFKIFLFWIFGISLVVSCSKDSLNLNPSDEFSELDVFKDPVLMEVYVNGIYQAVSNPTSSWNGLLKGEFVDEAHDMWYNYFEFNN